MAISDANYNYCSESHVLENNEKKTKSIFKAPLQFVGLGLDSDSLNSPTSPLDLTLLSNRGNPYEGQQQRIYDCTKLGLSIIDSLKDCSKFSVFKKASVNPTPSPQMIITKAPNFNHSIDSVHASKSLPKDFFKLPYTQNNSAFHKGESNVVFEIGETMIEPEPFGKSMSCSLDFYSPVKDSNFDLSSSPHFIGGSKNPNTLVFDELNANTLNLSASEIESSEDYTCVISHGPNPKKTHIFCDCILEICAADDVEKHQNKNEEKKGLFSHVVDGSETPKQCPYGGKFLTFCYQCNKKLEEGKDIYIYR